MSEKQLCTAPIVGTDGNIYNIVGICMRALRVCGFQEESKKLGAELPNMKSYDEALALCVSYCKAVNVGERPKKL